MTTTAGMKRKRPGSGSAGGTTKLAICTAIVGALTLGLLEISVVPFQPSYRIGRRLSSVVDQQYLDVNGGCEIKRPANPPHSVQPTWAASYPGSGAKLSWNLITALSGLPTTDDRRINGLDWHKVVSVKTHFPTRRTVDVSSIQKVHFPRALLILRHPKDAIPSYHNHLYEKQNDIAEHSTRAPLDDWIQWRDASFHEQMEEWKSHIEYWLDAYPNGGLEGDRLVVTYEGITDDIYGPTHAHALARFLDKSEGVDTVELDEGKVACVWRRIVKYKVLAAKEEQDGEKKTTSKRRLRNSLRNLRGSLHRRSGRRRKTKERKIVDPSSHRSGDSFRPYTNEQLDFMIEKLDQLRIKYMERNDDIVTVLESYLDVARLFR
eukprot:CAMPEP_0181041534 /NCGR_PEP_ID=MMETSP1070-20121207/11652_1 /TAXON_ID=265543 /ORGANISM="Minutocellus polymorphus, Strain NH13" /LENGTH=376 /DNA_ID=CAMNT_0023119655 /DNA_START=97 /DNA_END=1223 /DNA_ORIENTATION=+